MLVAPGSAGCRCDVVVGPSSPFLETPGRAGGCRTEFADGLF
jgi:hypothetical protein